jgi:hypothetical protein
MFDRGGKEAYIVGASFTLDAFWYATWAFTVSNTKLPRIFRHQETSFATFILNSIGLSELCHESIVI